MASARVWPVLYNAPFTRAGRAAAEETIMPKSTKEPRGARPPEDTQKIYAHAYGARLAKQVEEELESSRRKATRHKKSDGKG